MVKTGAVGESKAVGRDNGTTCIDCGYDLRATPRDGSCPECGTPVRQSLLRMRAPVHEGLWFDSVRDGVSLTPPGTRWALRLLLLGAGTVVLAGVLDYLLTLLAAPMPGGALPGLATAGGVCFLGGLGLVGFGINASLWRFTRPAASSIWESRHGAVRRRARYGVLAAQGMAIGVVATAAMGRPAVGSELGAVCLLALAALAAVLGYAGRLAGAVGERALRHRLRVATLVAWGVVIVGVARISGALTLLSTHWPTPVDWGTVETVFNALLFLGGLSVLSAVATGADGLKRALDDVADRVDNLDRG